MATVDEYVRMAEEAGKDGAHVAVLIHYWTAIEQTGYNLTAAPILLAAIQYAQRLKKKRDRNAVAQLGQEVIQRISPTVELLKIINQEIAELSAGGKENATT